MEELRGALGEKESIEHCYCIFDALFGRSGSNVDGDEDEVGSRRKEERGGNRSGKEGGRRRGKEEGGGRE